MSKSEWIAEDEKRQLEIENKIYQINECSKAIREAINNGDRALAFSLMKTERNFDHELINLLHA